jgi:hypothetical protein
MNPAIWILLASAAAVGGYVVHLHERWRLRWRRMLGGHRIRWVATETDELAHILSQAISEIDAAIAEDYYIEVVDPGGVRTPTVPNGRLSDGTRVGGSIRSERLLPITPLHWVAVVTVDPNDLHRVGQFLVHEVCVHIASMERNGHPDAKHTNLLLKQLEERVSRALKERQR